MLLSALCTDIFATHIVGGEVNYEYLGNNDYLLTLRVYRDCGPTNTNQTGFDFFAALTVYTSGNIYLNLQMALSEAIVSILPLSLDDPCLTLPPELCVEEAIYTQVVNLPLNQNGYDLVYQRCCRNPSIINIWDPSNTGATFTTKIPGTSQTPDPNSNPVFQSFPPVAICLGQPLNFDHSAIDIDGDELYYSFCDPLLGGTALDPQPSPAFPPPYTPVTWNAPFSTAYPMSTVPAISLDSETGLLTGTPDMVGQFVVGICVSEFRNGVLISTTNRDFQFNVVNCIPQIQSAIADQDVPCIGTEIQFENLSVGGTTYGWDFGIEGTDTDVSSEFEPLFEYPGPGTYTVTLIVNPGFVCADTTTNVFVIAPDILPAAGFELEECNDEGAYFNFLAGVANGINNASFLWDFGPGAEPENSTEQFPENIYLDDFGEEVSVNVTITVDGCVEEVEVLVSIPSPPFALIAAPDTLTCLYPSVTLDASGSSSDGDFSYSWSGIEGGNVQSGGNTMFPEVDAEGYYVLTVIDDLTGCASRDTSWVTYVGEDFIDPDDVRIPNVFSPNGDKKNDIFFPYHVDAAGVSIADRFDSFSMKVYSRWGNLVFESSPDELVWDGKNENGDLLSEGVYYYIITLENTCDAVYTREFNGELSLKY